jgi:hypothetical protein
VSDQESTWRETRLSHRVRRDFPDPGAADEVLRLLSGLAWYPDVPLHSERVQEAVVILARGNIGDLKIVYLARKVRLARRSPCS